MICQLIQQIQYTVDVILVLIDLKPLSVGLIQPKNPKTLKFESNIESNTDETTIESFFL